MLMGNASISTYTRPNVAIWTVLAFQAGLLNIGGLLACHSFVSHVTGYATLFGMEFYHGDFIAASGMLLVPFFYLLGAMMSGFLIDVRIQQHRRPGYFIVFGLLFLLLLGVAIGGFNGYFGHFAESAGEPRAYTLLAILGLACGVQNGLVTLVSKSIVRTTHLTGITTDLGIGIARVMSRGIGEEEGKANFMRIGIIAAFGLGSCAGAFLFSRLQFRGFVFPATISGVLFFVALYFQVIRGAGNRQQQSQPQPQRK